MTKQRKLAIAAAALAVILAAVGIRQALRPQALGDEQEVVMSADGFSSFTSCITPLLHGASIVGEGTRSDA